MFKLYHNIFLGPKKKKKAKGIKKERNNKHKICGGSLVSLKKAKYVTSHNYEVEKGC